MRRASTTPFWRTMEPTTPKTANLAANMRWSTSSTKTSSSQKVKPAPVWNATRQRSMHPTVTLFPWRHFCRSDREEDSRMPQNRHRRGICYHVCPGWKGTRQIQQVWWCGDKGSRSGSSPVSQTCEFCILCMTSFHMSRHTGDTHGKALVDNVMTSVKGGTLESAVVMRAKINKGGVMDINTYQDWARTIADAPALINSEVGTMETCQDCIFLLKLELLTELL